MIIEIINEIMNYAEKAGYPTVKPIGLLFSRGGYGKFNPSAGHHIVDSILRDKNPRKVRRFSLTERCLRETDSSKIGISNRHLSFFEMLVFSQVGNKDKLNFEKNTVDSYKLMTEILTFDKDKILVTYLQDCEIDNIHLTSKETEKVANIWKKLLGENQVIPTNGRRNLFIARIPDSAGGPGYEIYYKMNNERYIEIGSQLNYKMIFNGKNNISPTTNQTIGSGFGLERLLMVLEGKERVHDISLIKSLKSVIGLEEKEKELYDENKAVIADAVRAISFIIYDSEGEKEKLTKSQEKILKNFAKELNSQIDYLGIKDNALYNRLIRRNIDLYKDRYPNLLNYEKRILDFIKTSREFSVR